MAAMDEGVVEHLALPVNNIERKGQTAHHILKWDDGVVQLVVVGIKQDSLYLWLVIEIATRQVEILGKHTCHYTKRQ